MMKFLDSKSRPRNKKQIAGFTLVELMVTIAIFVFMTALILARYASFNSGTLLMNQAYDIALTIRQAQSYGISVRDATNGSGTPNFKVPYGVHFDLTGGTTDHFVFYADLNGNNQWDSGEEISTYYLRQGAKFTSLCVGNNNNCTSGLFNNKPLDILFVRPDPSPRIIANVNNITKWNFAQIAITGADGQMTRLILVSQTGEITVQ